MKKPKEVSQSITSVQSGLTADQSARQRRYFISMMIRTICFILTVVLPSPYRWIALIGAVTLPYIAVIAANAGRETIKKDAIFTSKRKRLD
jgi:archaellum biogenesis protein FlaJ (TadC family)